MERLECEAVPSTCSSRRGGKGAVVACASFGDLLLRNIRKKKSKSVKRKFKSDKGFKDEAKAERILVYKPLKSLIKP